MTCLKICNLQPSQVILYMYSQCHTKRRRIPASQPFFWYDNDKDFCSMRLTMCCAFWLTIFLEHSRNKLSIIVPVKRVNVFPSVFKKVIHGCISIVIDRDLISACPNLNANQCNVNVQWTIQLK